MSIERPSYDTTDTTSSHVTMVRDLATGKTWKLCDGFAQPLFLTDEKTVVVSLFDKTTSKARVRLLELMTGKVLATFTNPEKDRNTGIHDVAPDGKVVALHLGGKKGAPLEVWFLDARTLESRGKLIGKGAPDRYGWGNGLFTPDGKRYIARDEAANILIWNVAEQKVERTESIVAISSSSGKPPGRRSRHIGSTRAIAATLGGGASGGPSRRSRIDLGDHQK